MGNAIFKNFLKIYLFFLSFLQKFESPRGIAAPRVGPGRTIRAWMKYRVWLVKYRRTRGWAGEKGEGSQASRYLDARDARVGALRARMRARASERTWVRRVSTALAHTRLSMRERAAHARPVYGGSERERERSMRDRDRDKAPLELFVCE